MTKHGEGEIVAGTVMMLTGSNSREVVTAVKQRLAEIQAELPAGVTIRSYYDRAEFINRMLKTVAINLAEGALLVVVVLFLTLGSLRGSLIAALAIPLAMGIAVIGMVRLGVTGNLMSLGAIDFGLLVDGAIVMLELALVHIAARSITTRGADRRPGRLRDEARRAPGDVLARHHPPRLHAAPGSRGRRGPDVQADGHHGGARARRARWRSRSRRSRRWRRSCCSAAAAHDAEHGIWAALRRRYQRLLEQLLAHPQPTLGGGAAAARGRGRLGSRLGAEFVPRLDEGELSLDIKRLPSVSITEAQRLGVQVENVLGRFPEVLSVVTRTGRAEVATDPVGPDETEVMVKLRPKEEWTTAADLDGLGDAIKRAIEGEVPATFVSVSQPIEDRVNQLLAGSRADVVIKVFGDDLKTLKTVADEIGEVVRDVPGRGDWRVQRVLGLPLLEVNPDRKRLARYGMSIQPLLEVVEASRVGRFAGKIFEGPRRFDLMLLQPPASPGPAGLGELLVAAPGGQLVPSRPSPAFATRRARPSSTASRCSAGCSSRSTCAGAIWSASSRTRSGASPSRCSCRPAYGWRGAASSRTSPARGIACCSSSRRARHHLRDAVPDVRRRALRGGRVRRRALRADRRRPRALAPRPAVLHPRGCRLHRGRRRRGAQRRGHGERGARAPWFRRASGDPIVGGAVTVLRPVLTTALVAAVGFVPMALSTRAGAEVQRPLATVVIGGIVSSTVLALAVLPVLLRLLVVRPQADPGAADDDETTNTEQTPPAGKRGGGRPGSPTWSPSPGFGWERCSSSAKDVTVLGRSDDADLRLIDEGVSRRHAMVM